MNKHLLKTRLASIEHYTQEIKKLEAAKNATKETIKELVNSMREFFPFEENQLLINTQGRVVKLRSLDDIRLNWNDEVIFSVFLLPPDGWAIKNGNLHVQEDWPVSKIDEWKIIYQPQPANHASE